MRTQNLPVSRQQARDQEIAGSTLAGVDQFIVLHRLPQAEEDLRLGEDVLGQQHIQTGRAKGLTETKVIVKYGVRIAINPLVSRLGLALPNLLSGAVVTGIVLGLPTAGPIFLTALTSQDMYLAGAFLLTPGILTDLAGFSLLIPFSRSYYRRLVLGWVKSRFSWRKSDFCYVL